jgi:cytochrome P450
VTLVVNLLFGGHDTSRSMLAVTMLLLLQHPDQLAKLRGDASLMARAGEEALRFEPIIIWAAREPTEDLEVAGIALPAGEPVMLSILAANRDPEVFDAPDRFDITRTSKSSVSFGWGPHICLGAHLARAELEEAIPELLRICEHIEFAGDEPRWLPHGFIRRLDQLRVRFRPSAGAFAG